MKKHSCLVLSIALALSGTLAFAAPALANNEAFVFLNGLSFYNEKSAGVLEYKEGLVIGDRVVLLNKQSKFKVDGNERDYTKVRSPSGKEGWVRSAYVAPKSILGAVKAEEAIVYSEPRDVKMTAKTISYMTIVAVVQDGMNSDFAKVLCYDAARDAYFTDPVYVSQADLTYADVDINSLILFTTGKATKDKAIRQNFMKLVDSKYSASIFLGDIRAVLVPDSTKLSQPASGTYIVNDDNINVRSAPDEVNGQVVAKLAKDIEVKVVEVTTQSFKISGMNGPWYKIEDPAGWVYGPFLTPAQ